MKPHHSTLLLPFASRSPWLRAFLGLLPTALVLGFGRHLPPPLSQTPGAWLYPAVFVAAWIGGLWPGLGSTLACTAFSVLALRPQLIAAPLSDPKSLIRENMFLWTSVFFTVLVSGLQRALRRADEAIRTRDDFLSLASHELRTPLAGLLLQAQLRRRRLRQAGVSMPPEEQGKMLDSDLALLNRLHRLVDNMLDGSRIEAGILPFHPVRTELRGLLTEVADRFRQQLPPGSTPLEIELPEPIWGSYDELQLEQVVTNLLANALRYGEGKPVHLAARRVPEGAEIEVRDEGPGIAPEDQERIFHKYVRLGGTRSTAGLGLGLYLCRDLVRRHGGTITVKSTPGAGATFVVQLPAEPTS